jgi:hypothetical protein
MPETEVLLNVSGQRNERAPVTKSLSIQPRSRSATPPSVAEQVTALGVSPGLASRCEPNADAVCASALENYLADEALRLVRAMPSKSPDLVPLVAPLTLPGCVACWWERVATRSLQA